MGASNPNPPEGFYLGPMGMTLPSLGTFSHPSAATATTAATASTSTAAAFPSDDPSKKVRKPYTITKSRESWTDAEHDKFLEALQLFDRDWKKIEAFVGSKTVIQIRSHAQKYFLKVQKSGTNEHLPPPRPKRKAAHPYPQKASKSALALPQAASILESPSLHDHGFFQRHDPPVVLKSPVMPSRNENSAVPINLSHGEKVDIRPATLLAANNYCCSSDEGTPRSKTQPTGDLADQGNHGPRVLPDFGQVYSFLGSIFDPNVTGHLQKLKMMDPIDVETVLLLMRNLSMNLTSPDFEEHRRMLSSHEVESGNDIRNHIQREDASQFL